MALMADFVEEEDHISHFKHWLISNGARFGKIEWPSTDTVGGCRGAQAVEDIASEEKMIEIPINLMMSPPGAFKEIVIGPILRAHEDSLRGDLLLSLYIMFEVVKGRESFYFPYLRILPQPGSISQWTDAQLLELQNDDLTHKAKNRLTMLRNSYARSILPLCRRYPESLPEETFTYEAFLFAWYSVQARAFGRRLPWTALVPFADCLNHSNLQTKYDYNVGENGLFRLFPSGSNNYPKGCEVFNSYGRRHNDNLLLDYGFSILDNEWDQVDLLFALERTEADFERRRSVLSTQLGLHHHSIVALQRRDFPFDALAFSRVLCFNPEEEVAYLLGSEDFVVEEEGSERDEETLLQSPATIRIVSIRSELEAIRRFKQMLLELKECHPTTTLEDEKALLRLESATSVDATEGDTSDDHWRSVCAVTYRLTRKRILDLTMEKLGVLEAFLSKTAPPPASGRHLFEKVLSVTGGHESEGDASDTENCILLKRYCRSLFRVVASVERDEPN